MTTLITSLAGAQSLLNELAKVVETVAAEIKSPALTREEAYLARIAPMLNEASIKYQALAAYLQENKKDHDKEYRSIQRSYVQVMQELQQVQRDATKKREALCDSDFLAVSKISAEDVQIAKEEMLQANQIVAEAVMVKQLFQEVGTIVHQQGQGIDQIEKKVETIRIEIGAGVNELAHARQLQREVRQKHMIILCVLLLIAVAIIIPIILAFT